MIFSPEVIERKLHLLDGVLAYPELLETVVARHLEEPFSLTSIPRPWSPGGGATLFRIDSGARCYFLKVKHRQVLVESRLEGEKSFIQSPSLHNEAHFLGLLASADVPGLFFFEEQEGFCFLATEWLEPFGNVVDSLTIGQLMAAWQSLTAFVERLFSLGVVHTDLHEGNLCFRNDRLVVCDFEEARSFPQDLPYSESLDVCGRNRYGDVGYFPVETGQGRAGLTCLDRLRLVFADNMRGKMVKHLQECRFDQGCPFNLDELQEEDARIYQSVDFAGLQVEGQRSGRDLRKNVLVYFLLRAALKQRRPIRHLDLGSNLGVFCLTAGRCSWVETSLGLEAFAPYVDAAQALVFIAGCEQAKFSKFVCGVDRISDVVREGIDLCTMLSVYHHIVDRETFLEDLAVYRPEMLIAEFAVQQRYYPERGELAHEIEYIKGKLGYRHAETIMISSDYRRPIVLFSNESISRLERLLLRLMSVPFLAPVLRMGILGVGRMAPGVPARIRSDR